MSSQPFRRMKGKKCRVVIASLPLPVQYRNEKRAMSQHRWRTIWNSSFGWLLGLFHFRSEWEGGSYKTYLLKCKTCTKKNTDLPCRSGSILYRLVGASIGSPSFSMSSASSLGPCRGELFNGHWMTNEVIQCLNIDLVVPSFHDHTKANEAPQYWLTITSLERTLTYLEVGCESQPIANRSQLVICSLLGYPHFTMSEYWLLKQLRLNHPLEHIQKPKLAKLNVRVETSTTDFIIHS